MSAVKGSFIATISVLALSAFLFLARTSGFGAPVNPAAAVPKAVPIAPCGAVLYQDAILTGDLDCRDFAGQYALEFGADNVTLDCDGHTIALSNTRPAYGVVSNGRSDVAIENCTFIGGHIGVHAENGSRILVRKNVFVDPASVAVDLHRLTDVSVVENRAAAGGGGQSAIELYGVRNGRVVRNRVFNFLLSGIALYGSENVTVSKNVLRDFGDTGIGLFHLEDRSSRDLRIASNDISGCRNVGAIEIMNGCDDLEITGNQIHDNTNGIQIYSDQNRINLDIDINNNYFCDNGGAVASLHSMTGLTIRNNEFVGNRTAVLLSDTSNIRMFENVFSGTGEPHAAMLIASGVGRLHFHNNIVEEYDPFTEIRQSFDVVLAYNYWGGCPEPGRFFFEGLDYSEVPRAVGPVHLLACFEVDPPVWLTDEDWDGTDDRNCRRESAFQCR